MNQGRTFIAGPLSYKEKNYNLIVYYDAGYRRYSLQFVEGDWNASSIIVKAAVDLSANDQVQNPDAKILIASKVVALNLILKNTVFSEAPPPDQWVTILEAAILNLELKLVDGIPCVAAKVVYPV
jgi:hypothetical protein